MKVAKAHHLVQQFRIDNRNQVILWQLDKFARECKTEIADDYPIFLVYVDGSPVAYYYASPHVAIYPTVHPNAMTPRGFVEAATTVIGSTNRAFVNPLWLIDPDSKLASSEILGRIGLIRRPFSVWSPL